MAVVVLGGDRTAWPFLAASALVSIAGNGIHAWLTQGSGFAVGVAPPSVFLLWVTHLTVRLGQREDVEVIDTREETPEDPPGRALELITEGELSLREIARQLGTNDRTVRRWRYAARTEPGSLVLVGT
ncbi:MAG: sigma factor-like helix-turn-helix DNA-binding protein [Rhodococcus sp. (in: high G+C Gram-positive bacteria)]|nr:sigma factor-like helix-turn-helix DNA-binding protein [Rhodococcus sp. (in: high G+C Gram-positive bacteria)]